MTIRDLFNIILKILGIFFIKDILATVPQLLSVFAVLSYPTNVQVSGAVFTFIAILLMLLIYILICYYLVFRTNFIIDKLKLDRGFDQNTIPLNIHRSTILSIAIIVIGGLMVADETPNLCRQLFAYFQEKRMSSGQTHLSLSYSVLAGVKII